MSNNLIMAAFSLHICWCEGELQILQLPRQDPGPGLSWGWPEAAPLAFLPPAVRRDAACPDTADTGPGPPSLSRLFSI